MHASFPYDGGRNSGGGGGGGGGGGRGVEYGVRRPDALLPPPGLDQTDLVLHTSLVDDPQVSDDVRNRNTFFIIVCPLIIQNTLKYVTNKYTFSVIFIIKI